MYEITQGDTMLRTDTIDEMEQLLTVVAKVGFSLLNPDMSLGTAYMGETGVPHMPVEATPPVLKVVPAGDTYHIPSADGQEN